MTTPTLEDEEREMTWEPKLTVILRSDGSREMRVTHENDAQLLRLVEPVEQLAVALRARAQEEKK